ncbi:MAG: M10 family metallopeptidase C-terminal domain-containing protein [Hyphomicrobiaceae bacterium]
MLTTGGQKKSTKPVRTAFDSNDFAIMSLRRYPGGPEANTAGRLDNPQSLMQLDIAAVQHMYGANFDHNAADNTYTFSTTTGEMSIDGLSTGMLSRNRIYRTIWDGDGEDTYDLSNYAMNLDIDLRPGAASIFDVRQLVRVDVLDLNTVKFASGNVFNARLFEGDARSPISSSLSSTDADSDLTAQTITFTGATVNGAATSLADSGLSYTPGTDDDGTLVFNSAAAPAFAGLAPPTTIRSCATPIRRSR